MGRLGKVTVTHCDLAVNCMHVQQHVRAAESVQQIQASVAESVRLRSVRRRSVTPCGTHVRRRVTPKGCLYSLQYSGATTPHTSPHREMLKCHGRRQKTPHSVMTRSAIQTVDLVFTCPHPRRVNGPHAKCIAHAESTWRQGSRRGGHLAHQASPPLQSCCRATCRTNL